MRRRVRRFRALSWCRREVISEEILDDGLEAVVAQGAVETVSASGRGYGFSGNSISLLFRQWADHALILVVFLFSAARSVGRRSRLLSFW